jgi:RNA methyltransferase, TrmH family
LTKRAERDRTGNFIVEGPSVVLDAIRSGAAAEVYLETGTASEPELSEAAREAGLRLFSVAPHVMTSLTSTVTPQGAFAIARDPSTDLADLPNHDLVLVLAGISDPGNAGTLVRSAVGAGASAVVFTDDAVDPLHPKVVRATAGALFSTALVRSAALRDCLETLRDGGARIVGAVAGATVAPDEVDLSGPVAIVVGNEAHGLPEETRDLVDEAVGIPMPGPLESLNVAVAGSILLYEVTRQRRNAR